MVKSICDSYEFEYREKENHRYITYEYRIDDERDLELIEKINLLLKTEQKFCSTCSHFKKDGYFCGYNATYCDIHGNIESVNNPYYYCDGRKCKEYSKKEIL
jgi:hypothetical protein